MQWVEKPSIEKIRRLLEVSEQERHCEVLLTLKNLADVRRSPAPYSHPIIPRSLPSEIVDGEHFVITDLLSLLVGHASSSRGPEVEASSREQALRVSYVPSASTSGGSNSPLPRTRSRGKKYLSRGASLAKKKDWSCTPSIDDQKEKDHPGEECSQAHVEDFIPWVRSEPSRPSLSEEEEEEEEMKGLLDSYASRKQKRKEEAEREAKRAERSVQPPYGWGFRDTNNRDPGLSRNGV